MSERLERKAALGHVPRIVAFFIFCSSAGHWSSAEASFLRVAGHTDVSSDGPNGPILGKRNDRRDGRMQQVLNIDESVEDFESRQKPPFITIPGQAAEDLHTAQQQNGLRNIFDHHPDDFRDCMLIHQYANIQVHDSFAFKEAERGQLTSTGDPEHEQGHGGGDEDVEVLMRPGAVFDSETGRSSEVHVGVNMMVNLDGITNPVQVIPTGTVARWTSKMKAPLAGFLCMTQGESDSAPVLHTLPTPCVPTSLDEVGNALDPSIDEFEVWIGTTRMTFATTREAEKFCKGLGEVIASDMAIQVWDAEHLQTVNISGTTATLSESKFIVPVNESLLSTDIVLSKQTTFAVALERSPHEQLGIDVSDTESKLKIWDIGEGPLARWNAASSVSHRVEAGDIIVDVNGVGGQPQDLVNMMKNSSSITMLISRPAAELSAPVQQGLMAQDRLSRTRAFMEDGGKVAQQVRDPDVERARMPRPALSKSPNLMSFCLQAGVKTSPEGWTKGQKRLLVIVTDWKEGDNSLAPYSHQDLDSIENYKQNIFPKVQQKFKEMSFGQFTIEVTIVPQIVRFLHDRTQLTSKMPFPGLYEEARTALQGHPTLGEKYLFRNFDLTFVIHPQTAPVGTKGLAWVGTRGAICNGCETLSDNFKIMVAVHELGHNLGLSHASSTTLEYGNPFDWMGNYPDVVGLNYGVGYLYDLGWVSNDNIYEINDATLNEVNDMVTIAPFDGKSAPQKGQLVGVKISLSSNAANIYLSFRASTIGRERGLYIVHQDKTNANSKLVDCGCHSMSQQDAHLRKGWTYMDDSEQIVVKVVQESQHGLKVHIYRTPSGSEPRIRARALFTDGATKCPVTCQDSDLLISHTCAWFQKKGYCGHGAVKLHGKHLNIASEICPQTCNKCAEIIKNTPLEVGKAACHDRNIKISGMNCPAIAQRQMCQQRTSSGSVIGRDLCPASCDMCPSISGSGSAADDSDPTPAREVGLECPQACAAAVCQAGTAGNGGKALSGGSCGHTCSGAWDGLRYCGTGADYTGEGSVNCGGCVAPVCPAACRAPTCEDGDSANGGVKMRGQVCSSRASQAWGGTRYCGAGDTYAGEGSVDCSSCWGSAAMLQTKPMSFVRHAVSTQFMQEQPVETNGHEHICQDDENWMDPQGNKCEVYKGTIKEWGEEKVCKEHFGGVGAIYCRKTCGSCKSKGDDIVDRSAGCADNACIGPWKVAFGRCYQCADFPKGCTEPQYQAVFHSECPATCGICKPPPPPKPLVAKVTPQKSCQDEDHAWCLNLGMAYCSEEDFQLKCPQTCDLCPPPGTVTDSCLDMFSTFTCSRYASYGWCTRKDTQASVQLRCAKTCGQCGLLRTPTSEPERLHGKVQRDIKEATDHMRSGAFQQGLTLAMVLLLGHVAV